MVKLDLAERIPDVVLRRACTIPPCFCHIEILCAMSSNDCRQSGAPKEFGILLGNPKPVLDRFGFPVPIRSAEIPAARLTLYDQRLSRERPEQEIERGRIGVGARCVAVPGHLHDVVFGAGQHSRKNLSEIAGISSPRKQPGAKGGGDGAGERPTFARPNSCGRRGHLALGGEHPCRLPGTFFPPKTRQPLFEPRKDRRVIARRIKKPPVRRSGVCTLMVGEHDPCIITKFAIPLTLRQQYPIERLTQATFEGAPQKRLNVPHKRDVASTQASLLPEQPH
jgi:hypothetical protein